MKAPKKIFAAALAAAFAVAPSLTALADSTPVAEPISLISPIPISVDYEAPDRLPDNVLVSGTIEEATGGMIRIVNADENATIPEVVVHIGERAYVLDAVSGLPAGLDSLKEGDFVYAYINNYMTMSLPPQAGAQLILCNIPQDFKAPSYHTVWQAFAAEDGKSVTFTTDKGEQFMFDESVALSPYLTRNMVYLQNIVPGIRMLIWESIVSAEEASSGYAPTKAMLFAYEYEGYFTIENGALFLSNEPVDLGAAVYTDENGTIMLPLRAVCEALGWDVSWDAGLRAAAVSREEHAFTVIPGNEVAILGDTEIYLTAAPMILDGLTMISARDMAGLLNVFYYGN